MTNKIKTCSDTVLLLVDSARSEAIQVYAAIVCIIHYIQYILSLHGMGSVPLYDFFAIRSMSNLKSSPPGVIVGLLRCIVDQLTAGVQWPPREDVG
jgi:hypothetical protein